jgi:hypothetical protein
VEAELETFGGGDRVGRSFTCIGHFGAVWWLSKVGVASSLITLWLDLVHKQLIVVGVGVVATCCGIRHPDGAATRGPEGARVRTGARKLES